MQPFDPFDKLRADRLRAGMQKTVWNDTVKRRNGDAGRRKENRRQTTEDRGQKSEDAGCKALA